MPLAHAFAPGSTITSSTRPLLHHTLWIHGNGYSTPSSSTCGCSNAGESQSPTRHSWIQTALDGVPRNSNVHRPSPHTRHPSFSSHSHGPNDRVRLTPSQVQSLFQTFEQYKIIRMHLSEQNLLSEPLAVQASKLLLSEQDLQSILSKGYRARQTLLLANVPLVRHTVKKITLGRQGYSSFSSSSSSRTTSSSFSSLLSTDDLVQEGILGLIKAIDKFDSKVGTKFSTYAVYWIRASVLRFIQQKEELIRVPEYLERVIREIDEWMKERRIMLNMDHPMAMETLEDGDVEHVAQKTGYSTNVVREALRVKQRRQLLFSKKEAYRQLEDYMVEASSRVTGLQYSEGYGDHDMLETSLEQREHVKDVLGQFLSMKEMEALSWRYGLLSQEDDEEWEASSSIGRPVARDYEAEAENDIFGPNGILSYSSQQSPVETVKASPSKPQPHLKKMTKGYNVVKKGGRWGEAMSFQEVGEQMRVSAEYGRRLCASALKKLKAAADEGRLDPAMLF